MARPHQVAVVMKSYICLQTVLLMASGLLMAERVAMDECWTTLRGKQAA